MEFTLKNIILYDALQNVSGFAELKIRLDRTDIKVRHNLSNGDDELLLSVVAEGDKTNVFPLTGNQSFLELNARLNPELEIFICIIKRERGELTTLASGILNQDRKNLKKRAVTAKEIRGEIDRTESGSRDFENGAAGAKEKGLRGLRTEEAEHVRTDKTEFFDGWNVKSDEARKAETVKPVEIKEVDEILRKVCTVDEDGKGRCEDCPYRDYFYRFTLDQPEHKTQAAAAAGMFFDIVKEQIQNILDTNPVHTFLESAVEGSRFVTVKEGHAVGTVPGYICSAVYSPSRGNKPPELDGYAQWLPCDSGNPDGEGYWLSYQETSTGKQVSIE